MDKKKFFSYLICGILCCALGVAGAVYAGRGAVRKLNADLASVRSSLASATADSAAASAAVQRLSSQLVAANKLVADQQSEINGQRKIIDGIAETISGAGSDVGRQIDALAEGFIRLYSFYHPSAKASKASGS